jgi:hypothetical protein
MRNTVLALCAVFALLGIGAAIEQTLYTDSILWVYNSTCIETANWQYVFLNNMELNLTNFDSYDNRDIFVQEIKELGNKSVLADIFIFAKDIYT